MIGGAPIASPDFGSPYALQAFPGVPASIRFPQASPRAASAASVPWNASVAQQQPARSRPVFRAQREDDPVRTTPVVSRVAPIVLPTPEQLGVGLSKGSERKAIDWANVHDRLDRLGASCFHQQKMPEGGYRITCLLPTAQSERTHRIEAQAATEAEAVRAVLAQAEQWAASR
jgi:hypothetical protein